MSFSYKYISIASSLIIAGLIVYQINAQDSYEDEMGLLKKSQAAALQISQDTIAELQKRNAALTRQLNAAQNQLVDIHQGSTSTANSAAFVDPQAAANTPPKYFSDNSNSFIKNSATANAIMATSMVNSTYGDFIRGLHLSPSEKESLSKIFNIAMSQKAELQRQVAEGKLSPAEYTAAIKVIDAKLRESLSGYLYKEEMTAFDQYEATTESRAATKALQAREMDLERNAPGLTPDTRKYVAKVLADVMSPPGPQRMTAPVAGQNPATIRGQQLDTALQRIKGEGALDKSQISAMEDYVAQQKDLMESFNQLAAPLPGK